jgi:flagellar basal-body rod protein FlgB
MEILGREQQIMQAALEVRSARASLLASNVANADTPGYTARDLKFEDTLARVLGGSAPQDAGSETVIAAENLRYDRNDIDLNQQLAKAYENSLSYVATLKLYGDSVGRLRSATSNG